MSKISFISNNENPKRLDTLIYDYVSEFVEYKELSRSQIKNLILSEKVEVDNKIVKKPGEKVKKNSSINAIYEYRNCLEIEPYKFKLDILYQDQDIIVINKPVGLTMHPGAGNPNETLVNALFYNSVFTKQELSCFNSERPGIVHRLDKDTSGVIVVAKNLLALQELSKQFSNRSITRKYKALVYVTPRSNRIIQQSDSGTIDEEIGRHRSKPTLMQVKGKSPKSAITNYQVIKKFSHAYLLELKLETGRTHQIRVHLAHLQSPVIGDRNYGSAVHLPKELEKKASEFGRQALHAYKLEFTHPNSGKRMSFQSELPKDFIELINFFKNYE